MPALWDSLSWFIMVQLGAEELRQLLANGMVRLMCRACGSAERGHKRVPRPRTTADIESWIRYLDDPCVVRGCPNHQLEFHATREFRERVLTARTAGRPDQMRGKRLTSYLAVGATDLPNNSNFKPVVVRPCLEDRVYDHLVRTASRKITATN